jgi:NADH-quinone oxidoreductase subunit J
MEAFMFYILAVFTLASAFLVVLLRRPLYNVLFMILTMIGLAGFFILLHAEFIAMVQLIVYAGAIMVLFLFVIMLLNLEELQIFDRRETVRWWGGALIAVAVMGIVWAVFKVFIAPSPAKAGEAAGLTNTQVLGRELFTTYLLPFEIASVLLLAAIIGTVILVRKKS